jgi:hypothetical protein
VFFPKYFILHLQGILHVQFFDFGIIICCTPRGVAPNMNTVPTSNIFLISPGSMLLPRYLTWIPKRRLSHTLQKMENVQHNIGITNQPLSQTTRICRLRIMQFSDPFLGIISTNKDFGIR